MKKEKYFGRMWISHKTNKKCCSKPYLWFSDSLWVAEKKIHLKANKFCFRHKITKTGSHVNGSQINDLEISSWSISLQERFASSLEHG